MSKTYEEIRDAMEDDLNDYFGVDKPAKAKTQRAAGIMDRGHLITQSANAVGYGTREGERAFRNMYPDGRYVVIGDALLKDPEIVEVLHNGVTKTISAKLDTGCSPVDVYNNIYHAKEDSNDFNDL